MSENASITLEATALRASLRRLRRAQGAIAGGGLWAVESDGLSIAWGGAAEVIPVCGDGAWRVRVAGDHMKGLSRAKLPAGLLPVRVVADRLYVGTLSVPCAPITEAAKPVVPAFATERDLLLASYRHSPAELEATGHTGELARARARLARSVRRAANALAWLGLSEERVGAWVGRELAGAAPNRDVPSTPPAGVRLVVVDASDQIALFDRGDIE